MPTPRTVYSTSTSDAPVRRQESHARRFLYTELDRAEQIMCDALAQRKQARIRIGEALFTQAERTQHENFWLARFARGTTDMKDADTLAALRVQYAVADHILCDLLPNLGIDRVNR